MSIRFAAQAEFHRAIARAKRLHMLAILKDREATVSELADTMGVTPVNVSQELAPLRVAGIVRTRRQGKMVYYRLAAPKILAACGLIAEAMGEIAAARATAASHNRFDRAFREI